MAKAPSTWMYYGDKFSGDILRQDVLVPRTCSSPHTYYCALSWNTGHEGGGSCGLEDHRRGKAFIYSMWDSKHVEGVPVKSIYEDPWTETDLFGGDEGEGTGLKAMNFGSGWQADEWYTLVTRIWHVHSHTIFGFWIHNQRANQWIHIVTMEYPVGEVNFSQITGSFVEDSARTGNHSRGGYFTNGFKRRMDGGWYPFTEANFQVIAEESTKKHANNYDAGATKGYFYMTTGGHTTPSAGIGSDAHIPMPGSRPEEPKEPTIVFSITEALHNFVCWHVPDSSTPQFRYSISVNNCPVASAHCTDIRSHALHGASVGDTVVIEIEDIMGKKVSQSTKITG